MNTIEWVVPTTAISASDTAATGGVLILCDHASNQVPADVELGVDPALMDMHIAVDIGAAGVSRGVAQRLNAPAMLATLSRLVIDLNREVDAKGLIPTVSDGRAIPGNLTADRAERIARFHAPYHRAIARQIREQKPDLILSVHSFTPELEHGENPPRPWQAGVLYNRDVRAPRLAVPWLIDQGIVTGDNQPYSGRVLNATMNRHAEAAGIPYLGVEIRNDLISDPHGIDNWSNILANLVTFVSDHLAQDRPKVT